MPSEHGRADALAEDPTSADAHEQLRRRTMRGYASAIAVFFGVAFLMSLDWVGLVVSVPAIALAAVLAYRSWYPPAPRPLFAASLAVGLATLVVTAAMQNSVIGSTGFAITAGLWISERPAYRKLMIVAGTLVVAAIAALPFALGAEPQRALTTFVQLTVFGAVWLFTVVDAGEQRRLLEALERAKDAEREASLLRQRARFAADLHDIQGHTLHVIKLKAAVAARLQGDDPERTARELAAIQRLVAETIEQGRRLASGTHTLAFAAELANATELLRASGARVRVEGDASAVGEREADLAQVLREATTNILRHARPREVGVEVGDRGLTVENDGVTGDPAPARGLAVLGERVRAAGGSFEAGASGGRFRVRASFAERPERDRGAAAPREEARS